ncbi:hypothetical protein C8J57DRAFT_352365 [Mycena rebaudengoi]|nr:hypothetical protein C8J57DRAFT_352365 [Mycena rebaudengoi]
MRYVLSQAVQLVVPWASGVASVPLRPQSQCALVCMLGMYCVGDLRTADLGRTWVVGVAARHWGYTRVAVFATSEGGRSWRICQRASVSACTGRAGSDGLRACGWAYVGEQEMVCRECALKRIAMTRPGSTWTSPFTWSRSSRARFSLLARAGLRVLIY